MKTTLWPGRRVYTLLLGVLLVAASSCEKVEDALKPKLPDATQEGKGTFGCLLDNKVWLPYSDHILLPALDADLSSAGYFTLTASDDHDEADGYDVFRLSVSTGALAPGTYTLGSGFTAAYSTLDTSNKSDAFYAGPANQGTITITKVEPRTSTIGNITTRSTIVSGTFSFTATSSTTGKVISVQDGRFDVGAN